MFNLGDFVVYGSKGVCKVVSIGSLPTGDSDRLYYTLAPVYIKGSSVFTPVDNTKVVLRRLISKDEAQEILGKIPYIHSLDIDNEKEREIVFKEILTGCVPVELVKMLKNIYQRKVKRLAEGKKITVSDERYFKLAEDSLYGELAVSLGLERDKVRDCITEKIDHEEMIPVV